jgi:hypothetical protein
LTTCSQAQQPPKSAPSTKTNSAKATAGKEHADRNQYPAENPVVTIINNQTEPAPQESAAKAETDENLKVNRRLALFTGLLVAVGIVQFVALFWQGTVLKHHGTLIRQSAQETARIATALINGERAWVLLDVCKPNIFEMFAGISAFNAFVFDLVNQGKTVARLTGPVQYRTQSLLPKEDLPELPDYGGPPSTGDYSPEYARVLAPGERNGLIRIPFQEFIDAEKLAAIERRDVRLFAYGSFRYADSFGRDPHEVQFGYTYRPKTPEAEAHWMPIPKQAYNKHT